MFMGFFSFANALTLFGLVSSITSCFLAANGNVKFAIYMLFLATACEVFDKKLIPMTANQSPKHKQFAISLTSACDLVSFGLVPCFIAYSFGFDSWFDIIVYCFYIISAAIRTAHFKALEIALPNKKHNKNRGVPITASTYALTILFLLTTFIPAAVTAWFFRLVLIALGVSFILKIRLKRPNIKQAAMALGIELAVLLILLVAGDCKAPENQNSDSDTSIETSEVSE